MALGTAFDTSEELLCASAELSSDEYARRREAAARVITRRIGDSASRVQLLEMLGLSELKAIVPA
jgi:hypothetical protein